MNRHLGAEGIKMLTDAVHAWVDRSGRGDVVLARKRFWLVFLLLRYTGARLGEVLELDDRKSFDRKQGWVNFTSKTGKEARKVQLPREIMSEIITILEYPGFAPLRGRVLHLDQGHVRRKFYEIGQECGLPKNLANPSVLRRTRAVELLESRVPLPVVQSMLGQSSANLTAAYVEFNQEDIQEITRQYLEREQRRTTSARNAFFGKITDIHRGDIQSEVELTTLSGLKVAAVVTNDSLRELPLRKNSLATALIKAPWVILALGKEEPRTSARNKFAGKVTGLTRGEVTTEVLVTLQDGTGICAIVTTASASALSLKSDDPIWVLFEAFAVILNVN